MAAKKKRRIRSPHPGVVLVAPRGEWHVTWRARYKDPDTDRTVWTRLDPVELPSPETRRDWAVDKSKELARRKMDLAAGAPRATGATVKDVLQRYYDDHLRLGKRTKATYRSATDKLEAWCELAAVRTADDLTHERLRKFAVTLADEGRQVPARGKGQRGKRKATGKPRSANTVNRELRSVRTVLGYVRSLKLLPKMSSDDLKDALKKLKATRKRIVFLKPVDCQRLLEAALAHDEAVFKATRDEHAGLREKGTTAKFVPIAAFVAFVLLTGMRVGEALSLEWKEVDIDAPDLQGRAVGEIYLDENKVKTGHARTVALEVSPFLRRLLVELRKRRGKGKPAYSEWTQPVFDLNYDVVDTEAKRLRDDYSAPKQFTYQVLRSTCSSFLTNAPGIFGAASAYRSAKQLGHSITVAEKHYLGLMPGIPLDAKTLESAMGIESLVEKVMGRLLGEGKSDGDRPLQQPLDRSALN